MKVTIELTRPTWLRRPRSLKSLAFAMAMLLTLSVPAGVYAADRFTDVPYDSIFHGFINSIAGAGITAGCGGTNYCPSANVTREQMAAFLSRGLGRVAQSTTRLRTTISAADSKQNLASVTITVPGTSGTQFVLVRGSANLYGTDLACPCNVGYGVTETSGGAGPQPQYDQLAVAGYNQKTFAASYVFAAASGTHTYYFTLGTSSGVMMTIDNANVTAITLPFGSIGTSILGASTLSTEGEAPGGLNAP